MAIIAVEADKAAVDTKTLVVVVAKVGKLPVSHLMVVVVVDIVVATLKKDLRKPTTTNVSKPV